MRKINEYKRLFTFGCSLTNYYWPTWADILSQEIPEYYNYGRTGAGNLFISSAIVEANIKHNFTEDDLVLVMWSSVSREDRYKNQRWETPGNIYTQGVIDMEFVYKWADTRFYLIRDLSLIETTSHFLKNLPCDTAMMAMCKFDEVSISDSYKESQTDDVLEFFKDTRDKVLPNVVDTVYNGVWPQTPIRGRNGQGQTADYHPTPMGHYTYLKKVFPELITDKMENFAKQYETIVLNCKTLDDCDAFWKEHVLHCGRL